MQMQLPQGRLRRLDATRQQQIRSLRCRWLFCASMGRQTSTVSLTRSTTLSVEGPGLPLHLVHCSTPFVRPLYMQAYAQDVDHVLLDNLQFLMSQALTGPRGGSAEGSKFDLQDRAIGERTARALIALRNRACDILLPETPPTTFASHSDRFRAFATRHNVHVTLVVHPRKEPETAPLSLASVFGTAKATQEADNVLILQRDASSGSKSIDVKKNRYDGALGSVPLRFDEAAKSFVD